MVDDVSDATLLELRRGAIVLAVLAGLREELYGYSLRERLAGRGLEVAEGTLYPLLRRLESHGWLASRWDTTGARPRRYYRLSAEGEVALARLRVGWSELVRSIESVLALGEEETA